jgi:threonine aldolase
MAGKSAQEEPRMRFGSDNQAGALPQVLQALGDAAGRARTAAMPGYGGDSLTAEVEERISTLFEREARIFLVATGTAANALALSAYARPGGIVYCHRLAHILNDEAGGPEFLGSLRLFGLPGGGGRITPSELEAQLAGHQPEKARAGIASQEHHGQPMAVSISQLTEMGEAYSCDEIAAIAGIAHRRGLPLHMDGARFANALAALGCTPAEMSWKAGVDVLSFGATKNGCLAAEAVVFFDGKAAEEFPFLRKRAGHLFSKGWVLAAQMSAYLAGGLWLEAARRANAMAVLLEEGIAATGAARPVARRDGNELFVSLPRDKAAALEKAGAVFQEWPEAGAEDGVVIRLVTSFSTTEEEVHAFLRVLAG